MAQVEVNAVPHSWETLLRATELAPSGPCGQKLILGHCTGSCAKSHTGVVAGMVRRVKTAVGETRPCSILSKGVDP
jgi:hypothetical protein